MKPKSLDHGFSTYEEALLKAAELKGSGKGETPEYFIAMNAATALFIQENERKKQYTQQTEVRRKFITVRELHQNHGKNHA